MRFICTEFDQNINNLYLKKSIDQSEIYEKNYKYTKTNKVNTKDGLMYNYTTDIVRALIYNQFTDDYTAYTPSGWITAKAITGTDHTSTTNTFTFKANTCASLISSYFYTILAEDGIHFAYPERISTSVQIINFEVTSEYLSYETSYNYQGETGSTYNVSYHTDDTIKPTVIDSAIKSKRINKYKSKLKMITIQSGYDAKPLDYVLWQGNNYILISRSEVKTDLYIYTCVKEESATNTISASDAAQANIMPIGSVIMYGAATAPTGYLLCDGSAVSRTTYKALFTIISTTYGTGDTTTTFNLPDFRGVFPKGAGTTSRTLGKDANGNYYAGTAGTYLTDKFQGHKISFTTDLGVGGQPYIAGSDSARNGTYAPTQSIVTDGTNGTPRTGMTTEPQSLGIYFIIKY